MVAIFSMAISDIKIIGENFIELKAWPTAVLFELTYQFLNFNWGRIVSLKLMFKYSIVIPQIVNAQLTSMQVNKHAHAIDFY